MARAVGVAVGRLAMTLVATIFSFSPRFFFRFFSSVVTFSHRRSARIKKPILRKLIGVPKNLGLDPISRPCRQFWGPLAAILDIAGGAVLQAVSQCPRRR